MDELLHNDLFSTIHKTERVECKDNDVLLIIKMKFVVLTATLAALVFVSVATECPTVDGDEAVYFENDVYCNKFYECSNGIAFDFICAPGTFWNQSLTACDYPVDCDGKQIFTTTTTTTPATTTTITSTTIATKITPEETPVAYNFYQPQN